MDEDVIYNFINSMNEESKYCTDIMKNHINKELVTTKKDNEDFENFIKCWICDHVYVGGDVKVRDHCHMTAKYRGSTLGFRDCSINVKLNHKIPTVIKKKRYAKCIRKIHDL